MTKDRKPFIAINTSPAMSGYFATLYVWSKGEAGIDINGKPYDEYWFPEPEQTGIGRYADWRDANREGQLWAEQEGVKFIPATAQAVEDSRLRSEAFRVYMARIRELREADPSLSLRDASEQAKIDTGYRSRLD